MTEEKQKEKSAPFCSFTGGPLGLGDPDDKRLRKLEQDVLIKNKVRAAARERCTHLIEALVECAKNNGFLYPLKCQAENNAQIDCVSRWYHDKELNEKMKEEYLEERSEYRRTGARKEQKRLVH